MVSNGESSEASKGQNQNSLEKSLSPTTTATAENRAVLLDDESTATTKSMLSQDREATAREEADVSKQQQTGEAASNSAVRETKMKDSSHQPENKAIPVVQGSNTPVQDASKPSANGPTVTKKEADSERDSVDVAAPRRPLQEEQATDRQEGTPQKQSKPSLNTFANQAPKPALDVHTISVPTKRSAPSSLPAAKVAMVALNRHQTNKQTTAAPDETPSEIKPPSAAPPPLKIATNRPETSTNASVQQQRDPLVQQYGPYVHPSDTSVADARLRLRTALEQTRQLRSAFTDRVYEKYLVQLQPVPPNIDGTLQKIAADPIAAHRQLEQDIRWIRDEKEFEKVEAQKLQAAGSSLQSSTGIVSSDTVDQLEWFGAGLNLVILPENQNTPRQGTHRISAAAATAADMMLDRVRRAGVLRADLTRRRQAKQPAGGVALDGAKEQAISRLHLLSPSASAAPPRSLTSSSKGRRKSSSTSAAASHSKPSKKQPSMAGSALLSLNPVLAEETQAHAREKRSAATAALVAAGVGISNSARAITNRVRSHPFPDSVAGRRASLQTGRRIDIPTLGSSVHGFQHLAPYGVLDLPPVPVGKSRKLRKVAETDDISMAPPSGAAASIRTVLSQFGTASAGLENEVVSKAEIDPKQETDAAPKRKRIATEIGLMRSMRPRDGDAKPKNSVRDTSDDRPIEPSVSFSVLYALGLLRDAPSNRKEPCPRAATRLSTLEPARFLPLDQTDRSKFLVNVQRLKAISSRMNGRKRPFSEAFSPQPRETNVEQSRESKVSTKHNVLKEPSKDATLQLAPVASSSASSLMAPTSRVSGGADRKANGVPPLSLRGGGGDDSADPAAQPDRSIPGGSNPQQEQPESKEDKQSGRPATRVEGVKSEPHSPAREVGPPKRASSAHLPESSTTRGRNTTVAAFSPPRNDLPATSRLGHDAATIIAQRSVAQAMAAERYHAATSPLHSLHGHSIIPGMYSSLHHPAAQGASFGGRSDWSHLEAASGISPLSAMSLDQHRAAIMGLTARDRATRAALLAREQHHNAAVAAAVHRAAVPVGLTPQAAFLMGSNPGAASMLHRGTQHYPALGAQSAAAAAALSLSSSAALMSSRPSSSSSALTAAAQVGGSRPSSSSSKATRARTPSSADPRLPKRESSAKSSESTEEGNKPGAPPHKKPRVETEARSTSLGSDNAAAKQEDIPETKKNPPKPQRQEERKNETRPSVTQARAPDKKEKKPSTAAVSTGGMKYFEPTIPALLDSVVAKHVKNGRLHDAVLSLGKANEIGKEKGAALLEYLLAVGSAVPIPKALVATPLKERLTSAPFKSSVNAAGTLSIPREPVVATILVWLWVQHQGSFQRAFARSGRIDVDPECKFLIQAAIEAASRALGSELAELSKRGGALANALGVGKLKGLASTTVKPGEPASEVSPSQVDLHVAGTASAALMTRSQDMSLPLFDDLAQYLDEARLVALRLRCRERALLAAIVLRASTMSEQFSHAYVGSMVRAGEALGHGELFELLQDESTATSSMIPFDIFSDDVGAWEDPCRPLATGFTPELTGADLIRRAHARAMIQKSLRKMQERSAIRGGAPNAGPYSEPTADPSKETPSVPPQVHAPSRGRKRLQSLPRDATKNPGTGFAPATKLSLYNPSHQSTPLIIDTELTENLPYGKHVSGPKQRAFSVTRIQMERRGGGKRGRKQTHLESPIQVQDPPGYSGPPRSTHEVDWADVAEIFKVLGQVESKSHRRGRREQATLRHSPTAPPGSRTIIAPFCRQITDEDLPPDDTDEDAEDVSDEAVLTRHRVVLDEMKIKLDQLMESRQSVPARARARSHSASFPLSLSPVSPYHSSMFPWEIQALTHLCGDWGDENVQVNRTTVGSFDVVLHSSGK